MINLSLFPSRQIALYAVKLFLTRSLAVLVALVLILLTLDLLGESGKILAVEGNGDADLWRYAGLRLPLLVSRFLPFSVLLGTLIALAGLNQHSEVIAMKAAGISAHQILAPLILASLALAAGLFAFNETVVVRSARAVTAWTDNDYRPVPRESGILSDVWVMHGDDPVRADHVGGARDVHAEGVTIFERDGGELRRVIEARRAEPAGSAWRLEQVRVYDSRMNLVRSQAEMTALPGLDPRTLTLAKVDPEKIDFATLRTRIAELREAGRPSAEAEAGLWHKISGPLSTILMPLLAATAAFGLARSGQVLLRATVGMALGFAYFVADNFSLAMGSIGAYPPILAAWAPFVLFFLIGETVLVTTEE